MDMRFKNGQKVARLRADDGDGGGGDSAEGANGGGEGKPKPGDSNGGADGDGGQTYDQAHVNKVATSEAKRAAAAERKKLLDALGVENVDDAKAVLEAQRQAEEDNKDELTKATEAAQAATAAAQETEANARRAIMQANLVTALMSGDEENPPLRPDKQAPALAIGLGVALNFDGEPADAIEAAVTAVRDQAGEFFGNDNGDSRKVQTPGAPDRPGSQQSKPDTRSSWQQGQDFADEILGLSKSKETTT